jgi:hypothetical protein
MTSPQTPSGSPNAQPQNPADAAMSDAIAAEHATIYGYGFVSAHCGPDANDLVADSLAEHRERRDAAIAMLAARSVAAPIAAVGYQLPMPVNDATDAAKLAVRMEEDDATAWRAVIEQAQSSSDRAFGITALNQCAVRAARWRQVLQMWPVTVPFPGGSE